MGMVAMSGAEIFHRAHGPLINRSNGEAMNFDWFRLKSESNLKDHGVTFEEAQTAFYDPAQYHYNDRPHSIGEKRKFMQDKITILEGDCDLSDDIAPEYDLANMERAHDQERRFRAHAAARLIRLAPDVAEVFSTSEAVNEALRALIQVMRQMQRAA
jgi:hypothetical protein